MTLWIRWISIQPGIDDDDLTRFQLQLKSAVSQPRDLDHVSIVGDRWSRSYIPSPIRAIPGIETGIRPLGWISPNSSFTAAASEVGDELKVNTPAVAPGNTRITQVLPITTKAVVLFCCDNESSSFG